MRTIYLIALALPLAACGPDVPPSSDTIQADRQSVITKEAVQNVGLPNIHNYFEMRQLKRLLEMRDDPKLVTYTYLRDMQMHPHLLCKSIGYPVPGSTQMTNPSRLVAQVIYPENATGRSISGGVAQHTVEGVLPQSEPNATFSPASEDATWVFCVNPNDPNDVEPLYEENKVETVRWPLPNAE